MKSLIKLSAQGNPVAGYFGRISVYEDGRWLYNRTSNINRVYKKDALLDAADLRKELSELNGIQAWGL